MPISASASAKIILFGEHAVVYGQPAIAVPISSLRTTATYHPIAENRLIIEALDLEQVLPVEIDTEKVDDALAATIKLVLTTLKSPAPSARITLQSAVPMASGLGSGASVSTALARALAAGLGKSLSDDDLNPIIFEVEKLHHGTPSGIDNSVIVFEQPVFFVRGKPIEILSINEAFTLMIADTGKTALTRVAVSDVRKLFDADPKAIQPVLDKIGDVSRQAKEAIISGNINQIGILMQENQRLLQKLTVSSPELDRLVEAAMQAGALGAKLSGGGRGGNMIALVNPEDLERMRDVLLNAGAARVFSTTVGG